MPSKCITARLGALADATSHLEKGKELLATGQLADALTHFHAAIGRHSDDLRARSSTLVFRNRSGELRRLLSTSSSLPRHGKVQGGTARSEQSDRAET